MKQGKQQQHTGTCTNCGRKTGHPTIFTCRNCMNDREQNESPGSFTGGIPAGLIPQGSLCPSQPTGS